MQFPNIKLKQKTDLMGSRPKKVTKNEAIKNYELEAVIVKQEFANFVEIQLKMSNHNC